MSGTTAATYPPNENVPHADSSSIMRSSYACDAIIVNYNSGSALTESVKSALREGVQRVFVVDNDSNDESLYCLDSHISGEIIQIKKNNKNLGFAKACNIGAQSSTAQYLLFINPDCFMAPGSLSRMIEVLESGPSIGMVGPLLCNPDGSEQPGGRRKFPDPWSAFTRAFGLSSRGKFLRSLFPDFSLHNTRLPDAPTPVDIISGACMLVKRKALEDVHFWDCEYFLHCEDMDLCWRFNQSNWDVFFVPDAHVFHIGGACSQARPFFVEWHKHNGMLRFFRKFSKKQYPILLWWLVVLGVWLRFGLVSAYLAARLLLAPKKT